MLTRQGALVTAVSIGLIISGRLFGIFELFLMGAGGAALVAGAATSVGLTRLHLDVDRRLRPARIHAGNAATVELRVRNRGRRRTPLLQLRDAVDGIGRTASVVLAPLAPDQTVAAAYSLPGERRGVLRVGPLEVRITDPFGLAALSTPGAPVTDLTVWPAVDQVLALPQTSGDHTDVAADHPSSLSATGDDFYALRPYADGDDLRRVHWRASAKRDDLVVRQDEQLLQGRATMVLDTRTGAYEGDSFERAVSAAASVVVACAQRGFLVRLVTTAGYDSGFGSGGDHVGTVLEHLAVVKVCDLGHLGTLTGSLVRSHGRGALAVLTGDGPAARAPIAAPGAVAERGPAPAVVVFSTGTGADTRPGAGGPGRGSIMVDEATSFARAWNRAMAPSAAVPA